VRGGKGRGGKGKGRKGRGKGSGMRGPQAGRCPALTKDGPAVQCSQFTYSKFSTWDCIQ